MKTAAEVQENLLNLASEDDQQSDEVGDTAFAETDDDSDIEDDTDDPEDFDDSDDDFEDSDEDSDESDEDLDSDDDD